MSLSIDRRQWLKSSALVAASLAIPRQLGATALPALPQSPHPRGQKGVLKLNSNESPYGISEKARAAIIEAADFTHYYPHPAYSELIELIAENNDLTSDHVMLGAGSTELLSISAFRFGAQGGKVLMADPSYFDAHDFYVRVGADLQLVPLNESFEHDLDALDRRLTGDFDHLYVCNPNNPTATVVDSRALRSFCEDASRRTMVFIDEAYHDLARDPYDSMVDLVRDGANLLIFRTFSKIHGLAGARVGYVMAKPEIIEQLEEMSTNWAPISNLSLRAAIASYQDTEFLETCRARNHRARTQLYAALDRLGYFYVPSHTNFVLFRIQRDRREVQEEFRDRNIMLRTFTINDGPWIRVSMGTPEQMAAFVAALEEIAP
jgi:histidinol-phosphate aminotransferase